MGSKAEKICCFSVSFLTEAAVNLGLEQTKSMMGTDWVTISWWNKHKLIIEDGALLGVTRKTIRGSIYFLAWFPALQTFQGIIHPFAQPSIRSGTKRPNVSRASESLMQPALDIDSLSDVPLTLKHYAVSGTFTNFTCTNLSITASEKCCAFSTVCMWPRAAAWFHQQEWRQKRSRSLSYLFERKHLFRAEGQLTKFIIWVCRSRKTHFCSWRLLTRPTGMRQG